MADPRDHDWGFFVWMLPGFCLAFGVIAMFTIGPPFFLLGAVTLGVLLRRGPVWPADLGLIAGVGAAFLVIAGIQASDGDPTFWLIVGAPLSLGSSVLFWWLRCRPSIGAQGPAQGPARKA